MRSIAAALVAFALVVLGVISGLGQSDRHGVAVPSPIALRPAADTPATEAHLRRSHRSHRSREPAPPAATGTRTTAATPPPSPVAPTVQKVSRTVLSGDVRDFEGDGSDNGDS